MPIPSFSEFVVESLDKSIYALDGDPETRGGMDSYYGRKRRPHHYLVGKGKFGSQERVEEKDMSPEEVEAYHRGYNKNEEEGNKKNFGDSYDPRFTRRRPVSAR